MCYCLRGPSEKPNKNRKTTKMAVRRCGFFFSSGLADVAQGSILTEREASRTRKNVYDAVLIYAGSIYVTKQHNHRRPANPPARFAFCHQKTNQQKQTHSRKKGQGPTKTPTKPTDAAFTVGKKNHCENQNHMKSDQTNYSSLNWWASENEIYSRTKVQKFCTDSKSISMDIATDYMLRSLRILSVVLLLHLLYTTL